MIHKLALIDPKAKIDEGVNIGAYSVIGPEVEIGKGSKIHSHVVIEGPTKIGKLNEIFQFASEEEILKIRNIKVKKLF